MKIPELLPLKVYQFTVIRIIYVYNRKVEKFSLDGHTASRTAAMDTFR